MLLGLPEPLSSGELSVIVNDDRRRFRAPGEHSRLLQPKVFRALAKFGAPMTDLTIEDLAVEGTIFQIGIAPNRIDVITAIDGVAFDAAWSRRVPTSYGGASIHVISIDDLMVNKRTVGRPQDLLDLAHLAQRVKRDRPS